MELDSENVISIPVSNYLTSYFQNTYENISYIPDFFCPSSSLLFHSCEIVADDSLVPVNRDDFWFFGAVDSLEGSPVHYVGTQDDYPVEQDTSLDGSPVHHAGTQDGYPVRNILYGSLIPRIQLEFKVVIRCNQWIKISSGSLMPSSRLKNRVVIRCTLWAFRKVMHSCYFMGPSFCLLFPFGRVC